MTPADIATDISAVHTGGSLNTQTNFTYTMGGYGQQRLDDSNQFG